MDVNDLLRLDAYTLEMKRRDEQWQREHFGPVDTYVEQNRAPFDGDPFNDPYHEFDGDPFNDGPDYDELVR